MSDPPIKALAVHQPWADRIARGEKTIEVRTWRTQYRGPLAICATKRPAVQGLPSSAVVAVAELVDCRPFTPADVPASGGVEFREGLWTWVLGGVRPLADPPPVACRQGLFDLDTRTRQRLGLSS